MSNITASDIAAMLDHCREVRSGEWLARCPAHDDKSPSLTIKDAGGGRTLIHCFAGCGANDVLDSIGLELQDLYPPTDRNYHVERKIYERSVDELVIEIAKADRAAGRPISNEDRDREAEAFARILLGDPSPDVDKSQVEKNAISIAEKESKRIKQWMEKESKRIKQ